MQPRLTTKQELVLANISQVYSCFHSPICILECIPREAHLLGDVQSTHITQVELEQTLEPEVVEGKGCSGVELALSQLIGAELAHLDVNNRPSYDDNINVEGEEPVCFRSGPTNALIHDTQSKFVRTQQLKQVRMQQFNLC
jgi:hypothetical protein